MSIGLQNVNILVYIFFIFHWEKWNELDGFPGFLGILPCVGSFPLDKIRHWMVKYAKLNIVLNGKSTFCITLESLGHRLKARVVNALGKCVRERTKRQNSDK